MPRPIRLYVRWVEAVNRRVGRLAMYLVFVLLGILLYSSISRTLLGQPVNWAVEMGQFVMAGYYLLGGAYSMQLDAHVRMDLIYSKLSPRRRATTDAFTIFFLIFYLVFLLAGGISSTEYALTYDQRNYTAWAPPLAPIKIIMCIGIALMLLQAIATFFRDLAAARGEPLP